MTIKNISLLFTVLFISTLNLFAQKNEDPIKVSGVVLDAENLDPVSYATVQIKSNNSGTVADNSGYFALLAYPGDTVAFRSVGYQNSIFVIPSQLNGETYSLIELMVKENILLDEVVVAPLPNLNDFTRSFVKKELTDEQKRNLKNFNQELDQILENQYENNAPYYDQYRYARFYEMTGIVPPNNFLNPMNWSEFIRNWKKKN